MQVRRSLCFVVVTWTDARAQVYVRLGIRLLYKGVGSNRMEGARSASCPAW